MKRLLAVCILVIISFMSYSQEYYTITATIIDKATQDKLPFATLTLLNPNNQTLIGGAVSDENGLISVKSSLSSVQIKVDYIGYETLVITRIDLNKKTTLGNLGLSPKESQLAGIDLVGRRSDVEIRLDKRVYNVGQNLNAKGTNVSDVLENIPSLSLDLDGNLELRGSTNVRILIDGKPSGLVGVNGIDALADLPAESIERVEVITAPSARYQAEGSSGIVNIILAKNTFKGLNGVFNLSGGKYDSYGANASINYKVKKVNFFTNSGYRDNTNLGGAFQDNSYNNNLTYDQFVETRSFDRRRVGTNVNIGLDYTPTEKTKLTISYTQNKREGDDQTKNDQNHFLENGVVTKSLRSEVEEDYGLNKQLSLSLTHNFNDNGHKLDITLQRERNIEDEFADLQTQQFIPQSILSLLEENNTEQEEKRFLAQIDYVWPIDKNSQFEAGYRGTNQDQNTGFVVQTVDSNGNLIVNANLTNFLDFNQKVHAFYSQYGKKWGGFSILSGLRFEHTAMNVIQKTTNEDGKSTFNDFFPTLNLGFELSETANITIGYNRRISRPRSRSLNPFQSRSSETSFFQGNPFLKPSYSNGFDIGYLKQFKKFTFNSSLYFRRTEKPENRISVESGDFVEVNGVSTPVIKRFPVNLGRRDQLGIEANGSIRWSPKWRSNLSFNIFRSVEEGSYEGQIFDNENDSWTGNFRNNLSLPKKINTQINVWFVGANQSAFGSRKAFGGVSLGLNKDILNDNATINLNFSDVFNTSIYRWKTFTETITTEGEYQRRKPIYTLTFTYRFRQEKERQRRRGQDFDGEESFEL